LAVSPASLRGWRRRRLTPSPYISHYISPTRNLFKIELAAIVNKRHCVIADACWTRMLCNRKLEMITVQ